MATNQTTVAFVINRANAMQALIAQNKKDVTVKYVTGSPFSKHKYEININGTQYEVTGYTKHDLVDNSISFMQGFWAGLDK